MHARKISNQANAAIANAAVTVAASTNAKAIVVLTKSGTLARLVAKAQPTDAIVIAYCTDVVVARQLMLHRAIHPIVDDVTEGEKLKKKWGARGVKMLSEDFHARPRSAVRLAQKLGLLKPGEKVVILSADADSSEVSGVLGLRVATVANAKRWKGGRR